MSEPRAHIILGCIEPEQLTLEVLAACTGVHPTRNEASPQQAAGYHREDHFL